MEPLTNPRVDAYLERFIDDGDPIRKEMEALAASRDFPIVGPLVASHLAQLARMVGARRVFELGSGFGYSALAFARAVGEQGEVHCTERSVDNARLAEAFLRRAGVSPRVTFHVEDALGALRRIGRSWDVIFNDVDKADYPVTIDLVFERLRPGGVFITDNVLWHGRVLPGGDDGSAATRAVAEFTRLLFAHPGFSTTVLPVRDGVAVALRLAG